uniref:Uncharacterized protein n=1 Tax=Salix viminalis TaxID=40686 RepID=A0A6N2KL26_SALVM
MVVLFICIFFYSSILFSWAVCWHLNSSPFSQNLIWERTQYIKKKKKLGKPSRLSSSQATKQKEIKERNVIHIAAAPSFPFSNPSSP